jgi:hypothetical protein
LPTVRVNDIYMPPDGSTIRIATYGRGIWELAQIELEKSALADTRCLAIMTACSTTAKAGTLKITLRNQGPNNVNKGTLTFTSDNPHVTFPNGNKVNVPPMNKGAGRFGHHRSSTCGRSRHRKCQFHCRHRCARPRALDAVHGRNFLSRQLRRTGEFLCHRDVRGVESELDHRG